MIEFARIALFAWVPIVLLFFTFLPARTAAIWAFIGAWLFLPMLGINVPGLPDWTKMNATTVAVLLGILLFDSGRFLMLRPSWYDLPMVLWCLWPAVSALSMGQGVWEAGSFVLDQVMAWGGPYLVGRMYLRDPGAMRELATAIVIGGLIYVPLCLYEVRMSPQLHRLVYGYHQHSFLQTIRGDGYRPMVFMQHGLAVGMWMTAATLTAFWLWMTGAWKRWRGVPIIAIAAALAITAILCKSTGALLLLFGGGALLLAAHYLRTALPLVLLMLVPPVYMITRATQVVPRELVVNVAAEVLPSARVKSLDTRLEQEDLHVVKALERPIAGWGRMGDARVEEVKAILDGLWIIVIGQTGVVGLVLMSMALLLPAALAVMRYGARGVSSPLSAPEVVLAIILALYLMDSMLNAMVNPVFVLIIGGLTTTAAAGFRFKRRPATKAAATPPPRPAPTPAPAGVALSHRPS